MLRRDWDGRCVPLLGPGICRGFFDDIRGFPMLKTHPLCRYLLLATMLAAVPVAATATPKDGDAITVGRYTTAESLETDNIDPLAVVVQLQFPRDAIQNVGDALRYLLQRTGYTIRPTDDYSTRLFALPLPESQRKLGPARVSTLTQVLAGANYRLCVDRFGREIVVQADIKGSTCPVVTPPATTTNESEAPQ
jgi:conjugative transfer region protein (TIGR03748 family)